MVTAEEIEEIKKKAAAHLGLDRRDFILDYEEEIWYATEVDKLSDIIMGQVTQLPDVKLGAKTHGTVCVSAAPVRSKPAHSSEMISLLGMGEPLTLYRKRQNWYLAAGEDGYYGYVHEAQLHVANPCWFPPTEGFDQQATVYQLDATAYQEVTRINPAFNLTLGNRVMVKAVNELVAAAKTPDGRIGYVDKACFINPVQGKNQKEAILYWANQLMGTPNLWGGATPKGIDCSGFTQLCFWLATGKKLKRDASQQAMRGPHQTGISALQPGDLLFFGEVSGKITHVALGLGGNRYIHASGFVRVNSLNAADADFDPYRFQTFQYFVRVGAFV